VCVEREWLISADEQSLISPAITSASSRDTPRTDKPDPLSGDLGRRRPRVRSRNDAGWPFASDQRSLAHIVVEEDVDVLIVGARVAGSVLAALLGQDGRHVLVIDRATFPSSTLSTHFFRGDGCVGVLQRLGVLEEVLFFGSSPLVREYNADATDGSYTVDPPQTPGEVGFNLSVRRETLDGVLVERARREPTVEARRSGRSSVSEIG
jgi:FAD binding domain